MTYTKIGIGLAVLVMVVLIVLAFTSVPALRAPLVAVVVLVMLIAGGNWLNHYLGIERKPQEFQHADHDNEVE